MASLTSVSTITDRAHLCSMEPLFMGHSLLQKMPPLERYPSTEGDRYKGSQGYNEDVLQCMVLLRQHFIV